MSMGSVDEVVDRRCVAARLEPVTNLGELLRSPSMCCELGRKRLENAAQLEQLDGAVGIERRDVRALSTRSDLDESRVLQSADRLPNRIARHTELFSEAILEQPLARFELSVPDHCPDFVGDDLTQRAVSISEPARRCHGAERTGTLVADTVTGVPSLVAGRHWTLRIGNPARPGRREEGGANPGGFQGEDLVGGRHATPAVHGHSSTR